MERTRQHVAAAAAGPNRRRALAALAAWPTLGTLAVAGCGGGADRTKAQVRIVNASDYTSLDLRVEDALRQSGVGYGASTGYVEVDPSDTRTVITSATSATALLSFASSWTRNRHFTVLAYGARGDLRQTLLDENLSAPAEGLARLQVLNGAPDAGALDVYLTATADPLPSAVATRSGAAFGVLGTPTDVTAGTWRLRVTAANSKTDLRLDLPALALANRQVATLVLTPSRGGTLVNALLIVQQGEVRRHDNAQVRVRVFAGVTQSATVHATVGGEVVMNDIGSPAVSDYVLVDAGTPAVAIRVNQQSVAAPVFPTAAGATSAGLVAGGDYSLLVYGSAGAGTPSAAWIEDDNHLPTAVGQARLRLVHAAAGLGAASLKVGSQAIVGGVASGSASGYFSTAASTAASLSVTAVGSPQAVYTGSNKVIEAGRTYTVFISGDAGEVSGDLQIDR